METDSYLEMWNLTKATLTLSESFLSSELSGEKTISSGRFFRPPPYGWKTCSEKSLRQPVMLRPPMCTASSIVSAREERLLKSIS
jgi:hypothetical protein